MIKLILWILIPVALLTSSLLCYLLYTASIKKKKKNTLDEIGLTIKKERMSKIDALLNRVKVISESNKKHSQLFQELTKKHTNLDEKLNRTFHSYGTLMLNTRKMKNKEFDLTAKKIKNNIEDINRMQYDFETTAENITQQDEFMTSEIAFYTKNLRKSISVYRQKRILLDRISPKLDVLTKEIKKLEKEFNVLLDRANIPAANIILNKYSRRVIEFSEIINEGPAIQSYLYITIPALVKNLMINYKEKKEEVGGALEYINFSRSINEIAVKFKKAKHNYLNLKLDKTKKGIKSVLKSLKILERLINFEIKSRNTFINNYEHSIDQTKHSLTVYVNIRGQIKSLSSRNIRIPLELLEEYKNLSIDAKELDQQAISFRDAMKSKTISFSAKLSRMKLLVQKNLTFIKSINEITSSIWALNVEKLITKNKFRRAEAALNEIMSTTKKERIILSEKELQKFEEISLELSRIAPSIISDNSSKEVKNKVDNAVNKAINYYQVVGGKIQIAEIVKNMIKESSSKRAIDVDLNAQLITAETFYLRGDYDAALNLIITSLEEGE